MSKWQRYKIGLVKNRLTGKYRMKWGWRLKNPYPYLYGDMDCSKDLLIRLNKVGADLGKKIRIRSGRRTMAEQWELYNALGPKIAAYPSATAPHVRGIAADCGIDGINIGAYPGARQAMLKYDVCLRVANENWHVEVGGRDRWAKNWLP